MPFDTGISLHGAVNWVRNSADGWMPLDYTLLLHLRRGTIIAVAEEYLVKRRTDGACETIIERKANSPLSSLFWIEMIKADPLSESESEDGLRDDNGPGPFSYPRYYPDTDNRRIDWIESCATLITDYLDTDDPTPTDEKVYVRSARGIFIQGEMLERAYPLGLSFRDVPPPVALESNYTSPFIKLMLRATEEHKITEDRGAKEGRAGILVPKAKAPRRLTDFSQISRCDGHFMPPARTHEGREHEERHPPATAHEGRAHVGWHPFTL